MIRLARVTRDDLACSLIAKSATNFWTGQGFVIVAISHAVMSTQRSNDQWLGSWRQSKLSLLVD